MNRTLGGWKGYLKESDTDVRRAHKKPRQRITEAVITRRCGGGLISSVEQSLPTKGRLITRCVLIITQNNNVKIKKIKNKKEIEERCSLFTHLWSRPGGAGYLHGGVSTRTAPQGGAAFKAAF